MIPSGRNPDQLVGLDALLVYQAERTNAPRRLGLHAYQSLVCEAYLVNVFAKVCQHDRFEEWVLNQMRIRA